MNDTGRCAVTTTRTMHGSAADDAVMLKLIKLTTTSRKQIHHMEIG